MAFPELTKALIEKKVGEYCDKRVPGHLRNKVRVSYEIRGNNVTIFENRAPWHSEMTEWTKGKVAQIRYDEKKAMWVLYCRDRNGKWYKYKPFPEVKILDRVIDEIHADPTGIFWG